LIELAFFVEFDPSIWRRGRFWGAALAGLVFIVGIGALFMHGDMSWILDGYDNRPFNLKERLLTQPRVIWFYLSLLFYPIPTRLSIEHDFTLSTGLLQPWTTLPALLGIACLLIVGLVGMRRQPLLGFALLFYFLNHALESTFLPLEMVFEHRNYLPAMFLFVPAAAAAAGALQTYRRTRRRLYCLLVGFGIFLIMGWGLGTYIRNMTWATEGTLWRDALAKAPRSQRPVHNLAWAHYERLGDLDTAYTLYQKELVFKFQQKTHAALPHNNMANINYLRGNYVEAAAQWKEAARLAPHNPNYAYRRGLALFQARQMDAAIKVADRLIKRGVKSNDALLLKGQALLWLRKPDPALACFRRVFKRYPSSADAAEKLAVAHMIAGNFANAHILLSYAQHQNPSALRPMVWLARLSYIKGDQASFHKSTGRLAATYTVYQIRDELRAASEAMLLEEGVDPAAMDAAIMQALIAEH
jgi:tetratricopeptide (TPR) repeat protein